MTRKLTIINTNVKISIVLVHDMKFVLAVIAFAAFANAGVVTNNDEPITAKDIDKLITDINDCLDSLSKTGQRISFGILSDVSFPFQGDNFNGTFKWPQCNVLPGTSKHFSVSTTLGEKDLSITIGSMRSGITADGKIHLVGSANGRNFDKNGTYSFKWDDLAIDVSFKFLIDEKSMKLDQLTFTHHDFDTASLSVHGVNISEITQEVLEATVLDSIIQYRKFIETGFFVLYKDKINDFLGLIPFRMLYYNIRQKKCF